MSDDEGLPKVRYKRQMLEVPKDEVVKEYIERAKAEILLDNNSYLLNQTLEQGGKLTGGMRALYLLSDMEGCEYLEVKRDAASKSTWTWHICASEESCHSTAMPPHNLELLCDGHFYHFATRLLGEALTLGEYLSGELAKIKCRASGKTGRAREQLVTLGKLFLDKLLVNNQTKKLAKVIKSTFLHKREPVLSELSRCAGVVLQQLYKCTVNWDDYTASQITQDIAAACDPGGWYRQTARALVNSKKTGTQTSTCSH